MDSPTRSPTFAASNLSEPASPSNRSRSSSRGSNLKLDLSNLPPLTQPSKPSNTLLITNLQNSETFHPESLQNLQTIISSHAPIITWSPLKSFRRIVCSFPSDSEAIAVRQAIDGSTIMGDRVRVYFGEYTPVEPVDQHLHAPESKKLFFISPPPSPPQGWEMKDEQPPNALVIAEDLAKALSNLRAKNHIGTGDIEGGGAQGAKKLEVEASEEGAKSAGRTRSGSIMLFEPAQSEEMHMPSISVDDFSDGSEHGGSVPQSPVSPGGAVFHTARPPVEIMDAA